MGDSPLDGLTDRETQILKYVAEGDSLPEIAQKLHRSLKTIESHRQSLGRKLGVSNRVELARIAIASGLVKVKSMRGVLAADAASRQPGQAHAERVLGWLEEINHAVAGARGTAYLQKFCEAASRMPGVAIAVVSTPDPTRPGEPDPRHRLVVANAERGVLGEPMRCYALDTPCETIMREGRCSVAEGVAEAYPRDAWLQAIAAESFVGVRLRRPDGDAFGGVGLIGREPLREAEAYERVIAFFAPRLAAHLAVRDELDALRHRCEQLEYMVEAELDGADASPMPPRTLQFTRVVRRVESYAGAVFLRGLVDSICEVFAVHTVGICRVDYTENGQAIAPVTLRAGGVLADTERYEAGGTPCAEVVRTGFLSVSRGALERFPGDRMLQADGLDAYVGIRLPGMPDQTAGVMWVVDKGPLRDAETIGQLLHHFAPRVGAELAGFLRMETLMQEREELAAELKRKPGTNNEPKPKRRAEQV